MRDFTELGDMSKFSYQHFNNQILVEKSLDENVHVWIFMLELQPALFGSIKKIHR